MRNKFTELIEQGVARFDYTPVAPELPEQDPVCRMYNNIWSIPSDTHMFLDHETGVRYITGHMVSIPSKWDVFVYSNHWAAVNFRTTGFWSLADFLQKNGLAGRMDVLNGEPVFRIEPIPANADMYGIAGPDTPTQATTTESKIPVSVAVLTNDNNIIRIKECYKGKKNLYSVCEALNDSIYVKGNDWTVVGDKLMCPIGNKTYIL